ncbi:MAG: HD domain-containing protein [Sphingobacteriales bacterium]|nr:HD domain-containing protein [Sphingobacteriales bacterium]MBI3718332.1 HD domain-containing protein [Sphingobacteriales bacterium]
MGFRKIINDPVYGFITIDTDLIFRVISHPWYQRLRRIHQLAMASLVYPGAVHTRYHHALGAYHLMSNALNELKSKGVEITADEETGAKIAILLHDIGHGPFSHALEKVVIEDVHHEEISLLIMKKLNEEFKGQLQTAIDIFTGNHPKKFLHQLISGQLDVDRMDYLTRDSFFTGVTEGVIGYDRILKMLVVHNGELMIEEKGVYSIEKFLVARRLMYWQAYLHKTVLSSEEMLVRILSRAKSLSKTGVRNLSNSTNLNFFLESDGRHVIESNLDKFCLLDDYDVLSAIKNWINYPDKILSTLCRWLVERKLLKLKFLENPVSNAVKLSKLQEIAERLSISIEDANYFVFDGIAENRTYNVGHENIHILYKDGTVRDISNVDNALIQQDITGPVKKHYFCYPE